MDPRFVTRTMHAYLDYPVAICLITLPFVLELGSSNPMALWLAASTGIAAFILTLFTDHSTGVDRLIPYAVHVAVDAAVGVTFAMAPLVFGFVGIDAWFYWINAAAVLFVVSMSKPETSASQVTA